MSILINDVELFSTEPYSVINEALSDHLFIMYAIREIL